MVPNARPVWCGVNRQCTACQAGSLLHPDQAVMPGGGSLHVKAFAVIEDLELQGLSIDKEHHPDIRCLRVADDVGQRFTENMQSLIR